MFNFPFTVRRRSKFLENSFSFSSATREELEKFPFENNVEWHLFSINISNNWERQNDHCFSFLTKYEQKDLSAAVFFQTLTVRNGGTSLLSPISVLIDPH